MNRRVVRDVAGIRHLDQNLKADRTLRDSGLDLLEEEVCAFALDCFSIQVLGPGVRHDPIASVTGDSIAIDESHRGYPEEGLSGEARWSWLGRLHERECCRMSGEEFLDRRRLRGIARGSGSQEFQKLLA